MRLALTGGGAALGGVAGGIVGGPSGAVFGAQAGFTGGALLSGILMPAKSDRTQIARDDVRLSSSALGRAIPIPIVGVNQPGGQHIWQEKEPLVVTKTEQADKGAGPEFETSTSFFSFICGLCEGPVCAVTRLWFDDTLVFDISDKNPDGPALSQLLLTGEIPGVTLSAGVQSVAVSQFGPIRIYLGTEDQPKDPLLLGDDRIGAAFGGSTEDYVPPYAGLCHVACERIPGPAVNNHYPQVKAEVLKACTDLGAGTEYEPVPMRTRRNLQRDLVSYVGVVPNTLSGTIYRWNAIDKNAADPEAWTFNPVTASPDAGVLTPWNVGTWDDPALKTAAVDGTGNTLWSLFELATGAEVAPQKAWSLVAGVQPLAVWFTPDTLNPTHLVGIGETQDYIFSFPMAWSSETVFDDIAIRRAAVAIPGTTITSANFWEKPGFVGPDGLLYLVVSEDAGSGYAIAAFDPLTLEVRRALAPYTTSPASSDPFYGDFSITYDALTDKIIAATGGGGGLLRRIDRATLTVDPLPDIDVGSSLVTEENEETLKLGPFYGQLWLQIGAGNGYRDFDVWNWTAGPCGLISASADYGVSELNNEFPTFDPINQGLWIQGFFNTDWLAFLPLCRKSPLCGTAEDVAKFSSDRCGVVAAERITAAWAPFTICGLMTGQRISGADVLAPVMGWINGDYRMKDGKVEFITLDTPPVRTIPEIDLGAGDTIDHRIPQRDIAWPYERTLPWRVDVTAIWRDHDFQALPVGYDRPLEGFAGRDKESLQFPIVVDDDSDPQPIDVAERILFQRDVKRRRHTLALTHRHIDLLPGDAIDYVRGNVTYATRIEKRLIGETNKVVLEALRDDVTVLTPSGVGSAGAPAIYETPQLGAGGALQLFMLDGPLLRDQDDAASGIPVYVGVAGEHNGAALLRSDDGGANWKIAGTFGSGQSIDWGTASTLLADGPTTVLDTVNSVTLDLRSGVLSSASEADLNGDPALNAVLLGRAGRWEVLRYQTVVDDTGSPAISGDTYTISDLRRGRRCSDANTGLHKIGDTAILLDPDKFIRLDLPASELGVTRLYKAVAFGQPEALATPQSFTLAGIARRPCAVSQLDWQKSGQDWVITWNRRSRIGGAWPPQVGTPLGEAFERYTVRIIDTSTSPETVVRTVTVDDAETTTYTAAQQIADFGQLQHSLTVEVVQISEIVGEGYPSRATFDDGEAFDAFWDDVVFLSRMEADPPADLSQSAHSVTDGGAGATVDSSNQKLGAGCRNYDGTATGYDEIADSADWNFGAGDFTVEGWFRWNATGADMGLVSHWDQSGANQRSWELLFGSGNTLNWIYSTNGTSVTFAISQSWTPTVGQWYHVAVSRSGGTVRLFVDGTQIGSAADSATYHDSTAALRLGDLASGGVRIDGKADEVRITKGVGRYTANFTPDPAEFPTQL